MTAKDLEDRCRKIGKNHDGHVTVTFEDGYTTATFARERTVICCCRAGAEEAVLALEELAPQSVAMVVMAVAARADGKVN